MEPAKGETGHRSLRLPIQCLILQSTLIRKLEIYGLDQLGILVDPVKVWACHSRESLSKRVLKVSCTAREGFGVKQVLVGCILAFRKVWDILNRKLGENPALFV